MFEVIKQWYHKNFSDPNAVTLLMVVVLTILMFAWVGKLMTPVIVAAVFAFLLDWPVKHVSRLGLSRNVSTSIVITAFVGALTTVIVMVIPVIWQQSISLVKELPEMMQYVQEFIQTIPDKYPNIDPLLVEKLMGNVDNKLVTFLEDFLQTVMTSVTDLVAVLIYLILVPLMVFFMLKDKKALYEGFDRILPTERTLITQVAVEMNQQIINYIRGKMLEILIVGVASYIAFAIMDLRFAAVLGLLVGLSVLIPYIGAAVVTIPVAAVALFQFGLTPDFYYVIIAYGIIQALDGNVLVPLLFSEAVDLNPVYIIIAVLFFGGLFGFWGVFFAIPLASLVKALINAWSVKQIPESREQEQQATN